MTMSSYSTAKRSLLPPLEATTQHLIANFSTIGETRLALLHQLTYFVEARIQNLKPVYLNFICTHNSRRSHLSQLWAQAAAYYYGMPQVYCFSGGTEATAFNTRAVIAMQEAGFTISMIKAGENPVYEVMFAESASPVIAFSKKYDDPFNDMKDFAAIMTCSHADENCPLVPGATTRIALTYNDPKEFDHTPWEKEKYQERVEQIGTEILYAFSKVKK